jgi:hypothetical protein
MRKLSDPKISIFILVLIASAIACNFPDATEVIIEAAMEKCETVSRDRYVIAAKSLGQTPEIPSDPESAVYEVCYQFNNPSPVSARMYGGNKQEEEAPDGPSEENKQQVEGVSATVLAGTYIGDNLDIPPDWELVESEFIIEIAEDGTVSGSRIYIIEKDSVGTTCTWHWENGHTTNISGHISGANGNVTVENESYTISDSSDCGGSNNHKTFESVCDDAQITIFGQHMEINGDGSSDCGFVFTATKQ